MTRVAILALAMLVFLSGKPAGAEEAVGQQVNCPAYGTPNVNIMYFNGALQENDLKTAFQIARQKSSRYDRKMPVQIGNMGTPVFKIGYDIEMDSYNNSRCMAVKKVHVTLTVDHKVEVASDHPEGTCVYDELFNLEMELMQQDEEVINDELKRILAELQSSLKANNVWPVGYANLDSALFKRRKEIEAEIKMKFDEVEAQIFELRKQSDRDEFYQEILYDCSGQ
ncbi:MAG: hypothetical protein H6869_09160 [Rhodospirillales bacterium]|nr:hypothetical protein [Rhodospirillales bacterium]